MFDRDALREAFLACDQPRVEHILVGAAIQGRDAVQEATDLMATTLARAPKPVQDWWTDDCDRCHHTPPHYN